MKRIARRFAVLGAAAVSVAATAILPMPHAQAQTQLILPPEIGIRFNPDGDPGQCGGRTGDQWLAERHWTDAVRFDADGRRGGCQLAFGVYDPDNSLEGVSLTYEIAATPGGDPSQCGNPGVHAMPISRTARTFGSGIRIDTDNRPGGCTLTFDVARIGGTYVALDIQYDADGDARQCGNTGYRWAETDRGPVKIGVDTDDRAGGCRLQLRLRVGFG